MSNKRIDVLSKKDTYMLIAQLISKRSKDPNTQVGAVIVSDKDRILSMGYNGFPNGCSDDDFPWEKNNEEEYDTKYPYVCHAELNAILNFRGDNNAFTNSSLYVTLFPCRECTKAIIQTNISSIYYLENKYPNTIDHKAACRMLDAVGIKYIQHIPNMTSMEGFTYHSNNYTDKWNEAMFVTHNKNGCSREGIRYCSHCYAPLDVKNLYKTFFCYNCGYKFKK